MNRCPLARMRPSRTLLLAALALGVLGARAQIETSAYASVQGAVQRERRRTGRWGAARPPMSLGLPGAGAGLAGGAGLGCTPKTHQTPPPRPPRPPAAEMMQTLLPGLGAAMPGASSHPFYAGTVGLKQQFASQFQTMASQAETAMAQYEAQYCTPAKFTPSTVAPAKFVGHSFALTFSTGNCTFNETKYLVDGVKELDCVEPSISYVKNPANFTSKYHKAPK